MKLGLALAGGGIRGIAHAGVLKALEDNNIKVDIIGGCSSGSMVAALYAMGFSPYYIYILFKTYAKDIVGANVTPFITGMQGYLFNKKKTITGFKNGEPIEKIFDKMAKRKKITELGDIKIPLVIPTVDIMNSKEYIFTNRVPEGEKDLEKYITKTSIGKAVRASSCFPAVFSPCKDEKHAFMDGGLLDNVPVNEVIKQGADKVIAVKFDADEITEKSNVMDIAMKTLDIMGSKISEENLSSSDFVLNVYTDRVGLLDISKLEKCYKYGYECAMKNMDKIKKVIEE